MTLQSFGNTLAIGGVVLTFAALIVERQDARPVDFAPWLVKPAGAGWARVRRVLRRTRHGTFNTTTNHGVVISSVARITSHVTGRVWRGDREDDDIETRVRKVVENLEGLRDDVDERFGEHQRHTQRVEERVEAITSDLYRRVESLEGHVIETEEAETRATSKALPFEFAGLLLALVGSVLAIVGG